MLTEKELVKILKEKQLENPSIRSISFTVNANGDNPYISVFLHTNECSELYKTYDRFLKEIK